VYEPASKRMSLIVPAYNEEVRLPTMLDQTLHYLEARERRDGNFTFEIIIVDDGSRDNTARVALAYSKKKGTDKVRLLRLHCNHGKGGAVRKGMLRARGELLLMVDADAATRISDVERLEHQLRVANGRGVAIGSRHHLQADAVAQRACHRNLLMHGFNFYVSTLCVPGVKDTQCGFKLFTRSAARALFPVQHIERWAFDVELLHLCSRVGIPVTEVPVHWVEMPGSKINLFEDIPQMARDILIIRLMYSCRIWTTSIRVKKD
jgi:dolichyl-phosphate beta-glucosyltransferase